MDKRDKQVKVMLTGAEMAELTRKAGREPLSSYCRRAVLDAYESVPPDRPLPEPTGESKQFFDYSVETEIEGPVSPGIVEAVESIPGVKRVKKGPKLCRHGKRAKIDNCWQCGGLAVVE